MIDDTKYYDGFGNLLSGVSAADVPPDPIYDPVTAAAAPAPGLILPVTKAPHMTIIARLEALEAEGVAEVKKLWNEVVARVDALEVELGLKSAPALNASTPNTASGGGGGVTANGNTVTIDAPEASKPV